jgi:outer membrane protein OmpA-like peptidoglycan-associated protein
MYIGIAVICLVVANSNNVLGANSLYDQGELDRFEEAYKENISWNFKNVVLKKLSDHEKKSLGKLGLKFIHDREFAEHLDFDEDHNDRKILVPIDSIRFLDDLSIVYALHKKQKTSNDVLEAYLGSIKYGKSERERLGLSVNLLTDLGISRDALESDVEQYSQEIFSAATVYLLSVSVGRLYFGKFSSGIGDAEGFGVEILRRLGVVPKALEFYYWAKIFLDENRIDVEDPKTLVNLRRENNLVSPDLLGDLASRIIEFRFDFVRFEEDNEKLRALQDIQNVAVSLRRYADWLDNELFLRQFMSLADSLVKKLDPNSEKTHDPALDIDVFRQHLDQLRKNNINLAEELNRIRDEKEAREKEYEAISKQNTAELEALRDLVIARDGALESANQQISSLKIELAAAKMDRGAQLEALQTELSARDGALEAATERISGLSDELTAARTDSNAQLEALRTELSVRDTALEAASQRISGLSDELAAARTGSNAQLEALRTELSVQEVRLEQLLEELDLANAKIKILQSQDLSSKEKARNEKLRREISKLNARIKELEPNRLLQRMTDRVFFRSGSYQLSEKSEETLMDWADWMALHPEQNAQLVGHTDSIGIRGYNERLAALRVESVREKLVEFGVPLRRLSIVAFGENAPRFSNTDASRRALNRRVVFVPSSTSRE